ncbi:MAG: lysylphosphatidylglycerol synthase domain-containing protein [Caldilineaceae bacterium]
MWRRWFDRLQPIFLLLAFLFVAALLRSQWDTLRGYDWRLNPAWLVLSAGLMVASWAGEVYLWVLLIRLLGSHLPYGPALRMWFLSALVRYIPGNVWQPLSLTLYCQQRQIRPEVTVASIVLFQVVVLLAIAPLAAFYFQVTGNWGLFTGLIGDAAHGLILLVLLPVLVFLVKPAWLLAILNWLLRKVGRAEIVAQLTSGRLLLLLLIGMVDWLLWGATFATVTLALGHFSHLPLPLFLFHLVVVYPIGYAIGFLSLFTPSGFGVREGAYYLLLAPLLGGGLVTVAALAMRLWNILGEVVMALVSFAIERRHPLPLTTAPVEPTLESPR